MDALIQQAIELAKQGRHSYTPIRGRIAYLVNHGRSDVGNNYEVDRTQGVAIALQECGLKVYCLGHPGRIQSLEAAVAQLEEALRSCRPEKILAASDTTVSLPAWIVAQRLQLPLYIEVRTFPELERDAREPGYAHTPTFEADVARSTFVVRQAEKVFTLSTTMKDELARRGVDPGRIELVPIGLNELPIMEAADPVLRERFGIKPGDRIIGCDGRSSAVADLDTLLDACVTLVAQGDAIKLLLVGDDPVVSRAIARAGVLSDRTWLLHARELPDEYLAKFYALIDVLVIPWKSLPFSELVPTMDTVEALAYGKRLVLSNLAVLEECAEKYEGVLTFEVGSAVSLAQALKESLKLPASKPGAELLLSTHTEPMMKALKWEGGASARDLVSGPQVDRRAQAIPIKPGSDMPKKPSDFKVAIVADEFTGNSFCQEFKALPIEPGNWLEVFEEWSPDVFFCESAWSGFDSVRRPWKGRIYASKNFKSENRRDLFDILDYCRKAGIPTVFWNKEDPTHHNDPVHDFVDTAKYFDYVFTTAGECIESYKSEHKIKNVFVLPFASNPRLFNPEEEGDRSDHAVFAGSWYANHENRCSVMESILDGLVESGFELEIYDRFFDDDDPLHGWPEKYKKFLRPSRPHHEMPGVYKSSKFGLNFNTVTESPTMFARRVFELMSSNTLVVSNYSKGMDEMFGDLVVFQDRDPERLKSLTPDEVASMRHKALHEVLRSHTYKQRWRSILKTIGLPFVENDTSLTFTYVVKERAEALSAISWYQQYGVKFPESRLLLVVDISTPPLNVAKFYQEFNRYGVSVTSALHAERYAMVDRYRPIETSHFVAMRPGVNADAERIKDGALHLQYMTESLVALEQIPGQRYRKKPVGADVVVMGRAGQFADWLKHHTHNQTFTAYLA